MNMFITSTDKLTHIDGVPVRLWEGVTPGGIPCLVFIHRIAVKLPADTNEFERELNEQLTPGTVFSLRQIL